MNPHRAFLAGLSLAGLVLGLASGEAVAGTVTGTVKDSVSNAVISGVLVKVNQQSGKQATTNTSGVYSITSVTAGTVTLNASKTAYIAQNSGNVVVPSSGTVTAPVILLVKMGTITGTVVNASGGAAVSGATVTVTGTSTSTTTSTSGTFTLYQPTGTVTLTITKSGWATVVTGNVSVTNNQTTAVGNIQLTQNGTLSGKVVNALGGAAISSATVTASPVGTTTTTSSTGTFSLSLPPGAYTLTITKTGWISKTTSSFTVTSNTTTATGSITLSQSALTGTVVSAADATPVSGATVKITGTSNSATTDASGGFTLSLAPATVTLTVTKTGWVTTTTGSLTTTGGQVTNAGNIPIAPAGTLSGTVVNGRGGSVLSGATVTATPGGVTATTNGYGAFSLSLGAGTYTLAVTKSGWIGTTSQPLAVAAGQTTSADTIRLWQSAANGKVVDAAGGTPIANVTVSVSEDGNATAVTDANGDYSIGIATGYSTLFFSKVGWWDTSTQVQGLAGQIVTADTTQMNRATMISGRVVSSSGGTAIAEAFVTVSSPSGPVAYASTDADGYFSVQCEPGSYTLDLTRSRFVASTAGPFDVVAGQWLDVGAVPMTPLARLTAVVVDASTNAPLQDIVAASRSYPSSTDNTDASGRFSLYLEAGSYEVDLTGSGYVSRRIGPYALTLGETTDAGTLSLVRCGTVTGVVVAAGTNAPLSGAQVFANGTVVASTATNGTFTAACVPAGTETIAISANAYTTQTLPPMTIVGGQSADIGTIALSLGGVITGRIESGTTGWEISPNAYAWGLVQATVTGTSNFATANSQHVFSLPQGAGTFTLTVKADNAWEVVISAPITVVANQTVDIGVVRLRLLGTLSGTVMDAATLQPIAGATVRGVDSQEQTLTRADGTFSMSTPSAAQRTFEASAAGYYADQRVFQVTSSGATFWLSPATGTRVTGTMTQDTAWDIAGSPYVVNDLIVADGVTLTVQPGVVVKMDPGASVEVRGRLLAVGVPENPIRFRSVMPTPGAGDFFGLGLDAGNNPQSTIAFAILEGGGISRSSGRLSLRHVTYVNATSALSGGGPGLAEGVRITNCDLSGASGVSGERLNAALNYWGAATGPSGDGPGAGRPVYSASFEPWLVSPPTVDLEFTSAAVRNATFNPTAGILAHLSFTLSSAADWTVSITKADGSLVRTLGGSGAEASVSWDGKDAGGIALPNGTYSYRMTATNGAASAVPAAGRFILDSTKALQVTNVVADQGIFSAHPSSPLHTVTLSAFVSYADAVWVVSVRDGGGSEVRAGTGTGNVSFVWDGRTANGTVAPDGLYTLSLAVSNDAAVVTPPTPPTVTLDSTPPAINMSFPTEPLFWSNVLRNGATLIEVTGAVSGCSLWTLEYAAGDAPADSSWHQLSWGRWQMAEGPLGSLETRGLSNGVYSIRLKATDSAQNVAVIVSRVSVGNVTVTQSGEEFNPSGAQSLTYTSQVPFPLHFILNIRGESGLVVRHLVDAQREQGSYQDPWDGKDDSGVIVPGGAYFHSAIVSDGINSYTLDLSGEAVNDTSYSRDMPNDKEFDSFNNQPMSVIYSFPKPSRVYVVFNPTGQNHLGCTPPGYCDKEGVYESSGPHTATWAGVDSSGLLRRDLGGGLIAGMRDAFAKNVVVVYGREVTVSNVRVIPPYFVPALGPQTISFDFAAPVANVGDAKVVIRNAETGSLMRTLNRTALPAGHVELPWDGTADGNGQPVAPGPYTVTVTVTDPIGQSGHGSILTTIEY